MALLHSRSCANLKTRHSMFVLPHDTRYLCTCPRSLWLAFVDYMLLQIQKTCGHNSFNLSMRKE